MVYRLKRGLVWACCIGWLGACASPGFPPPLGDNAESAQTLYVISNGWHTGIVIARKDVPSERIPEAADFAEATYLEFGWGDREYYPAKQPTFGMALAAALTPTPAVVHLAGRDRPPRQSAPGTEVLAVAVTERGLNRLTAYLHTTFDRPNNTRARSVAPGLYPSSRFYPATGQFHLGNTCNTWTARMLAAAGLPLSSDIITADDLMERLRALRAVKTAGGGAPHPPPAVAR